MITLFSNIEELNSVVNVLLLSHKGELLYDNTPFSLDLSEKKMIIWKGLLSVLKKPVLAEFEFDNGLYLVQGVELGYLIVGLQDRSDLDSIRVFSLSLRSMLSVSASRKKSLLQILFNSHDMLKPQIVEELIRVADTDVALNLLSLLQREKEIHPFAREKLVDNICKTLGQCGAAEALAPLKKFLKEYQAKPDFSRRIIKTLQVSIKQLEILRPANKEKTFPVPTKVVVNSSKFQGIGRGKNSQGRQSSKTEAKIDQLLQDGKKDIAVSKLMELIERAAKQNYFDIAERLRDKLIAIDSMLLKEVIRAAEIIEEEKSAAIDPTHLEVWRALAAILSQEEFSAVYHMLESKYYPSGEMIVHQGDFFSNLLFVNSGEVQLFVHVNNMELVLKVSGPGEIIGTSPFFESSVWTSNIRSLGAKLFCLSSGSLSELNEKFPAIESKLRDFCALFTTGRSEFIKTQKSRRQYERKKATGSATITFLGEDNKKSVSARGDLFDISRGGISLCVHISKRTKANALFGKKIKVSIPIDNTQTFQQTGVIIAVRSQHLMNNEYSIHVVFDELLAPMEMQEVMAS